MIFFVISLSIIFLDQISKYYIAKNISFGDKITVINDLFYVAHWKNYGAAFGILNNARYFFIIFTIIISSVIVYLIYKLSNKVIKLSLSFILGGAVGNFIDRVRIGGVIDFIDVHILGYHYPTFNVADMFIVIGALLMSYYILFVHDEKDLI